MRGQPVYSKAKQQMMPRDSQEIPQKDNDEEGGVGRGRGVESTDGDTGSRPHTWEVKTVTTARINAAFQKGDGGEERKERSSV